MDPLLKGRMSTYIWRLPGRCCPKQTGWWQLKYFLFSSRFLGEWSNLTDAHIFQMGWLKPPTKQRSICFFNGPRCYNSWGPTSPYPGFRPFAGVFVWRRWCSRQLPPWWRFFVEGFNSGGADFVGVGGLGFWKNPEVIQKSFFAIVGEEYLVLASRLELKGKGRRSIDSTPRGKLTWNPKKMGVQ